MADETRGAAWDKIHDGEGRAKVRKACSGHIEQGPRENRAKIFYADVIQTGSTGNRPAYNLYLTSADTRKTYKCGLFKDDPGKDRLANGSVDFNGEYGLRECWVSMFMNKSQDPRSPLVDFTLRPKEPQQQPAGGYDDELPTEGPGGDNIPF